MNIIFEYYNTPIGELKLGSYGEKLVLADWRYRKMRNSIDQRLINTLKTDFVEGNSLVIDQTKQQLTEYFDGKREEFNIPIKLVGTDFQISVWEQLQKIPFGKTDSYLQLSKDLGNVKAVRAVASANGANGISIIVPCHRIIGSNNDLVGYAGGIPAKKKLLQIENRMFETQLSIF